MTPGLFLLLSLGGGLGAAARFALDGAIRARFGDRLPWGTAVINVSGSLALGLLLGLAAAHRVPEAWEVVLGTGFLGGYTTFSTASSDTVRLLRQGRWAASLANGLGMLVLSVAVAAGGYAVGLSG